MGRRRREGGVALPTLDDWLPEGVDVAVERIADHTSALLGDEPALIARAVPSRRAEFATGRVLARRLLAPRGHAARALGRIPETRLPDWPDDVVGSISHAEDLCVVALADRARFRGLGIDVEPDAPTDSEIERVVLRGAELDWVGAEQGREDVERRRRTRVVFSVKEAVYKAFYPTTRTFWSFQDVGVEIDLAAGRFEATLPESAGQARCAGRVLRRDGWIASGVVLPEEAGA